MLGQRVITAVILVALLLAALFLLPLWVWKFLALGFVLLASYEWAKLANYDKHKCFIYLLATSLIYWLALNYNHAFKYWSGLPLFGIAAIFWFVVAPLWLKSGYQNKNLLSMAITGWVVIVPTAIALIVLNHRYELLVLMAIVWISDTAAYFVGRKFGKRKLAPTISPGKTWEGAIGGLTAVFIYAEILQLSGLSFKNLVMVTSPWKHVMITALFLLLACLGILGDLFESWMKRTAGVKDSGNILPGHGGVLDRIDALTSTLPIAALALQIMGKLD